MYLFYLKLSIFNLEFVPNVLPTIFEQLFAIIDILAFVPISQEKQILTHFPFYCHFFIKIHCQFSLYLFLVYFPLIQVFLFLLYKFQIPFNILIFSSIRKLSIFYFIILKIYIYLKFISSK